MMINTLITSFVINCHSLCVDVWILLHMDLSHCIAISAAPVQNSHQRNVLPNMTVMRGKLNIFVHKSYFFNPK
jgi:hypothetical protein